MQEGIPGSDILVLDERDLCCGATGRNGGHCWPSARIFAPEQISKWGLSSLYKGEEWKFNSSKSLIQFLIDNQIDCDLHVTGCCNISQYDEDTKELHWYTEEIKDRAREIHGVSLKMLHKDDQEPDWKDFHLICPKAIAGCYQDYAAQFWPRKAVLGLAKLCRDKGVTFCTGVHVEKVNKDGSILVCKADEENGLSKYIHSSHFVFAMNAYSAGLLPLLKGVIIPVRGQVMATNSIKIEHNTVVEQNASLVETIPWSLSMNDGYEYIIHRRDDGRVIFGGNRWKATTVGFEVGVFDDSTCDPQISQGLESMFQEYFPKLSTHLSKEYMWTGIMGYTCDGFPLIGQIDHSFLNSDQQLQEQDKTEATECKFWIAAGYTGNGMTMCWGASSVISKMITGKLIAQEWLPQYNPNRFLDQDYLKSVKYDGSSELQFDE